MTANSISMCSDLMSGCGGKLTCMYAHISQIIMQLGREPATYRFVERSVICAERLVDYRRGHRGKTWAATAEPWPSA
jgi:hypothetical protein